MNLIKRKQLLRQQLLAQRKQLSQDKVRALSINIIQNLQTVPQFQQAQSFFIYIAVDNEVRTQEIITTLLEQNKTVTIPKIIDQKQMIAVQINDLRSLQPNSYGILEPKSNQPHSHKIDICLTPGVAFSKKLDRLGQGGGYYDQYITQHPDVFTIGLAYDFQIVDKLPTTQHDKKVRIAVTEKNILN